MKYTREPMPKEKNKRSPKKILSEFALSKAAQKRIDKFLSQAVIRKESPVNKEWFITKTIYGALTFYC